MRTFVVALVLVLFAVFSPGIVHAEGTYANIGTTNSTNGAPDAVSWSQGYPFVIDSYGKYMVPIDPNGTDAYNVAFSNDKGATWSEYDVDSTTEFSNRSSVVYDPINDKLHVIQATAASVIYKRYLILRDKSNNIVSIVQDPTLTPLTLDTLGSCTSDDYANPIALFKNEGSNGMIVAFWSTTKSGCGGQDITETRATYRSLSNSSADGTAGNWHSLNNTSDKSTGTGPAVVDYNILYAANTAVSNIRQHSAMIRGGSGAKSEDIYYFNVDTNDTNGFRRLAWNDSDGRWSGTWTSRVTFGGNVDESNGYNLKQELLSKPVYAEAQGKVYVGIARWLDNTNGDTQSLYGVDDSDTVSLISNVYSAGGAHCIYPTFDLAYDQTTNKLYFFYLISGATSVCGNTYYKTYDGSSMSSGQAFYTVANRSVDIPVTYQSRYDDKMLLFFRVNNQSNPGSPPHDIYFGYVPLTATTPSDVQTLSSGTYSATTTTDFEKACVTKTTSYVTDRSGGEVALAPSIADDFVTPITPYTLLDASTWGGGLWGGGSYYPSATGLLTVSGLPTSYVRSSSTKLRKILEFRAKFTANNFEHIGFDDDTSFVHYIMFSTGNSATLRTRVADNGSESGNSLGTSYLGSYHTYKIDWQTSKVDFYIDDVLVDTVTTNIPSTALNVIMSDSANASGGDLAVDWIKLYDYPSTSGSYTSCILDSGAAGSTWGTLNFNATKPSGTDVTVNTRTSDDAITWSSYSSSITSGDTIPSSSGRYLQYKVNFTGTSTAGPQLNSLDLAYATPAPTPTPTPTPSSSLSSSSGGSSSSNSDSGISTPSCNDQNPETPQLYAILPEANNSATLYFTDPGTYTDVAVRYGLQDGQWNFGTEQGIAKGTRTLKVYNLQPGQKYFFQIRFKNGCKSGEWSNTLSVTAPNLNSPSKIAVADISAEKPNNTPENSSENSVSETPLVTDTSEKTQPKKYSIKVKLTDENGGVVAGAKVILHSDPKETTSDENGVATFTDVEPGQHTLIVQSEKLNGEQQVTIGGPDPNLVVTVTLRHSPFSSLMLFLGGVFVATMAFGGGYLMYKRMGE